MTPKNTICLWFDKDALEAARLYAATFPDSSVRAVHKAPGDYPNGKEGDVLTVEFTVLGIPCLGLDGGPTFSHSEAFSFQVATDSQEETDRYVERDRRQWRQGKCVRLVQGPLGPFLADHAARADGRNSGGGDEAKRAFAAMMPMTKIESRPSRQRAGDSLARPGRRALDTSGR